MDVARILEMVRRDDEGFRALAASVDLIGTSCQMAHNPTEARARLNDLQQGFGEALHLYPGGEAYRVCFAGDFVFVVREIEPAFGINQLKQRPSRDNRSEAGVSNLLIDLRSTGHFGRLSEWLLLARAPDRPRNFHGHPSGDGADSNGV
ncbi:MAG: hypothetical protein LAP87_21285 [Acidobacteriia bacterium]|nr:hypothetical protein [Terriglobia bacterium]